MALSVLRVADPADSIQILQSFFASEHRHVRKNAGSSGQFFASFRRKSG